MDAKEYQSVLTEAEILKVLQEALEVDFRLLNYVIKPASDNPMGFLGEHYRIVADVSVDDQTKQCSYFVKKIPTQVPQHLEYALGTKAFYKEVELYKTLFADLKNAQRNVPQATKWRPEYYYSRGSDIFVLEDLSNQGYYMYPERCCMDEEHVVASLKVMAAMHAASFIFEQKFNAGKVSTLSPFFKRVGSGKATVGEIYAHLTFETEATDVKGHPGNTYHEAGMNGPVKIVEYLSEYSEEEKRIIQEKLPDVLKLSFQLVKPSDRYKNVFVHGDLWANNLLFRKDDTGKVKDALIIDFQLARYAPPAHDVMMFLHLVQNRQFRQDRQRSLLECYYSAFSGELEKNSLQAETILPWDTFLDSCNFYEDLGLICKLFYYQLILAPPDITSEFLSSPDLFTKTMLTDRTEMVVECFLKDEICRDRITEGLNDLIKSCHLTAAMLTPEEVSRIAENLVQGQQLLSYDLSDRSEEAIGYLGKHLTLTLNFASGKRKLFVKTYTVSPDKEDYLGDTGIFKQEQNFYRILLQDMKELEGEHNWCPECYFSKERVLVLEDLSEKGYKIAEDGLGLWELNKQHLEVAIETLASMHATSMMLEFQEDKSLPAMYSNILRKGILYDEDDEDSPARRWISWQVQDLLVGVDFLDKYSSDEKKFIKENFEKQIMRIYPLSKRSEKYKNTFTHGDMWKNNLLFQYSPDGVPIDCKFVDFQFIRYAPPAHDIMHLLNYALKKSERIRDEPHYLRLYYKNLKTRLESSGQIAEDELSEEELLQSCKEHNELALIQCTLSLHYILGPVTLNVEAESYDKYEEYLKTHRNEYMRRFFDRESYADKIKDMFYELIDDYILIS